MNTLMKPTSHLEIELFQHSGKFPVTLPLSPTHRANRFASARESRACPRTWDSWTRTVATGTGTGF